MDRFLCIHGHFYQPPRENPWLEAIEVQDSAHPYHDWNERIDAESYSPNRAARILDSGGKICEIVSNYEKISFNVGPTLLSWMETESPETYRAILDADRRSRESRSGHGNALAQAYNHIIMPLATRRDKKTQIAWGIADFVHRFGRFPEGMWLPETAVDSESLDLMAEAGIRFTILAPHQAGKVRKKGAGRWKDISGGRIDPSRSYVTRLPSGREMNLFFYDGPISRAVAFEGLLSRGEVFADRLVAGFSGIRTWPQLMHIATDGETYGHHHKFGEMALAYALDYVSKKGEAVLTNYGEFLDRYPPLHEVQIVENTSWSCFHGIERWRSDCGCNSGGKPGWNQSWRGPLREALDWLRDELAVIFETKGLDYCSDPWSVRDHYIDVILDRSDEAIDRFITGHADRMAGRKDAIPFLKLMEMERHALLMYTSCGWFFDELSGIETVQILEYAARALQLGEELSGRRLEPRFLERLVRAKSNIPEIGDGGRLFLKEIKQDMITIEDVAAHYAITSVVKDYPPETGLFCFDMKNLDFQRLDGGKKALVLGKAAAKSRITKDGADLGFAVLHLGGHTFNGGVRRFISDETYGIMKRDMMQAFEIGDFAEVVRLMDVHFGMHSYSFLSLFRDEQRKVLAVIIAETLDEFEVLCRNVYENNRILMNFLADSGIPVPAAFTGSAEFIHNTDLKKAFSAHPVDLGAARRIFGEMARWKRSAMAPEIRLQIKKALDAVVDDFARDPSDTVVCERLEGFLSMMARAECELDMWKAQNIFYTALSGRPLSMVGNGGDSVRREGEADRLRRIGVMLNFSAILMPLFSVPAAE